MKSLRESLLDNNLVNKTDELIKDNIKQFLKNTYTGSANCEISEYPNKDDKYEVSSTKNIEVTNYNITSLTNGSFVWIEVRGDFNCSGCSSLKSLEGAPKEVGKDFECPGCSSLKSLKGAPEKVGGSFYCSRCNSLTSLEGAPEKVRKNFNCSMCNSLIYCSISERLSRNAFATSVSKCEPLSSAIIANALSSGIGSL